METAFPILRATESLPVAETSREPTDAELLAEFVEHDRKSAFETLVRRHSPMVMGVCRRVAGDAHHAEDAFQATFMVLLRKAKSLSRPELLANWLYGVAFRVARKVRIKAAREQPDESTAEALAPDDPGLEPEWAEVKTALDEELSQLPAKYRLPLVLCYLDGKTNIEAARLLGCPNGSIANRLSIARAELKKRLLRRGMVLSAALLTVFLKDRSASADVPESILAETLRRAGDLSALPAQTPAGRATDFSQDVIEAALPTASAPLAESLPSAPDDSTKRKPRRKLRRFLQAALWVLPFSWILLPISELVGGSLADVPHGVQKAWSALAASRGTGERGLAGGSGAANFPGAIEIPEAGSPAETSAEDDERCKRCLGTNCGTEDSGPQLARSRRSPWRKLFSWR